MDNIPTKSNINAIKNIKQVKHVYLLSAHGKCIIKDNSLCKYRIPKNLYILFVTPLGYEIQNIKKSGLDEWFEDIQRLIIKGDKSKFKYAKLFKPGQCYPDLSISTDNSISNRGYHYKYLSSNSPPETLFGDKVLIKNNKLSDYINNYTNNKNEDEKALLVIDTCRTILVNNIYNRNHMGYIERTSKNNKMIKKDFGFRSDINLHDKSPSFRSIVRDVQSTMENEYNKNLLSKI